MPEPIISPADYHKDYNHLSRSMLQCFMESRKEFFLRYVAKEAPEETPSDTMKLGSLAHCLLLTPSKAQEEFEVIPESLLSPGEAVRTKEAKHWVTVVQCQGKSAIKPSAWLEAEKIVENIKRKIGPWLEKAENIETPIYWTDELTGIKCRMKPDFVAPGIIDGEEVKIIVDIKTTLRVIPHTFSRRFEDGGYWLQDSHYRQGVYASTGVSAVMFFPAIEQRWPYRCAIFRMKPEDRQRAFEIWRGAMNQLAHCRETGDWQDPWENAINEIEIKPWTFRPYLGD